MLQVAVPQGQTLTDVGEERNPSMRLSLLVSCAIPPLLAAAAPSASRAQTIPSPYTYVERRQEAGAFVGYMDAARGRFGFGPSGGMVYGGRWGLELSGPVSLEGVARLVDGTRDVINPGRVEGDRVVGDARVLLGTVDARLKFSFTGQRAWHGLSPFIVAGGGIALDLAGSAEAEAALEPADVFDFGTSFLGTAGVGTRWFATERFTLRADGIFSLWRLDTPPGFSDPARGFASVPESEWARGLTVTIGLLYRW